MTAEESKKWYDKIIEVKKNMIDAFGASDFDHDEYIKLAIMTGVASVWNEAYRAGFTEYYKLVNATGEATGEIIIDGYCKCNRKYTEEELGKNVCLICFKNIKKLTKD